MNLFGELEGHVRAYVQGQRPFHVLQRWIMAHVPEIDASADARLQELADEVWILSSEWQEGWRNEQDVRDELRKVIEPTASQNAAT